MTGGQTSLRERVGAVFFAFVMVTSMVAIGGAAFAGTASAQAQSISNPAVTDLENDESGSTQTLRIPIDADSSTSTLTIDVVQGDTTDTGIGASPTATAATLPGDDGGLTVEAGPSDAANGEITVDVSGDDGDTGTPDGTLVLTYGVDTTKTPFDAGQAETVEITDGASTTSATVNYDVESDGSGPEITSATTLDEGNSGGALEDSGSKEGSADNGQIDTILVTFDKNVKDSTLEKEDFLTGAIGSGSAASGVTTGGTPLDAQINDDNVIALEIPESRFSGTGVTPDISYDIDGDGDLILQTAGTTTNAADQDGAVTSNDGAEPEELSSNTEYLDTDSDGQVDRVDFQFSEDISSSTLEQGDFTIDQGEASKLSIGSVGVESSSGQDEVEISVSSSAVDTDLGNLDVEYTAGAGTTDSIVDAAGNAADDVTDFAVSDAAAPVIKSAQTSSVDSNGNVDEISTTFSEDLGDQGNVETDAFSLSIGSVVGFQGDASTNPDTTTNPDVLLDVANIQGGTATPVVTAVGGTDIEDTSSNTQSADTSVTASNGVSASLDGDSDANIATDIGSDGNGFDRVLAGNASEQLGLIRIQDVSGGSSPLAAQTTLEMPDGITINESASDFTITTTSGNLEVTDSSVENGGSTLVLSHGSTSSDGGQTIRIQGMAVDVAPNASASQSGVRGPDNDVTVNYAIGELDTSLFQVQKAGVDFEPNDDPGTFGAGTTDNTLNDDIRVTAPADLDGGIAGGSDLVINANQSNGVTFNTDFDPTTLTASGGVPGKIDTSSASLSETQLTIPVTDEFAQGESVTIDTDGSLPVDLAGDAQASQLTASFRTNQSTGQIEAKTAQANQIGVNRPVVDLGDGDVNTNDGTTTEEVDRADSIVVGKNNQLSTAEDLSISLTSAGQISDGSDVVITTNRSDVTFDTDASITNDGDNALDTPGSPEAEITANADGSEAISSTSIEQDRIVLTMNGGTDGYEGDEVVALGGLPLEVAPSVPDDAEVSFNVTTEPSAGTTVLSQEADGDFIGLERPDISLNGDSNVTVDLDSDGTQTFVDPATGSSGAADGSQDALVIDSDDVGGQIVGGQTVTIALEDNTGVTFNQTQSVDLVSGAALNGLDNQAGDGVDDTDTVDIDVSDNTALSNLQTSQTEISFQVDSNVPANQRIHVDQLYLNASASAQNTTVSVTTNTGDNEVTTVDNKLIKINTVEPSNVFGDANIQEDSADADVGPNLDGTGNGDFGGVNSEEATDDGTTDDRPVVDETITSRVYVEDGGSAFGGATVDLEVVQTPDGSSGASLNTTSVVTEANGVADFGFTVGDTNGVYVVNASTDSGSVNITYDAEPGQVADVNVTPIENAIVGGSNDLDQAALYVNATDANGNPVGANPTVDVTADNVGASEIGAYEDKDPDGSRDDLSAPNAPDDDLTDGSFTIDDTNNDGSSVLEINSDQVEDVTVTVSYQGNSDSGTVTFYDSVGQVDLALNQSTVQVDDTVAAEATISESDGTTIEVPGVTVDYDDNNNGNTTLEGGPDSDSATTNASGVASVNVTPEQNGTSTINVQSNLRSASATLTIGGQPDTGSPLDGTAGEYDSDGDGKVTASELGDASTAFANGELNASELGDVAVAFANS